MNNLKSIFDLYINSSIHVSLAVFCLSLLTLINFQIPYNENVLNFIFFASITGYNFVKYFGIAKFHHRRLTKELKIIQIISLLSFFFMCYFAFQLQQKTLYGIGILALITFLYAVPLMPKKMLFDKAMNLRAIGGFKVYIIAMVWCAVTVLIPIIDSGYEISWDVIITAVQRFIFVLILILPFEIRDMQYDSLKLSTIPQQIGVRNTKIIGILLLLPFLFLEFFKDEMAYFTISILLIVMSLMILVILFAKEKQSEYFASFWVEGIPIFWLLATLFQANYF